MAAYLFMKVLVTDDDAYAEFRRRAPTVIGHYGGRISTRGDIVESQEKIPMAAAGCSSASFPPSKGRWRTATCRRLPPNSRRSET